MAITIENLKTSTNFLAGTQLKASDLNEAFWQPLLLTNALAKAIASRDVNLNSVVEQTITAETPNLDEIFAEALNGILKYKPRIDTYNYARIRFEDYQNNNIPSLILESVLRTDVNTEVESNRVKILPNSVLINHNKVNENTSSIELNFENGKSTISADKFEGTATHVLVEKLIGNEANNYAIVLGKDNVVNCLTDFTYLPSEKKLFLPANTEIIFSNDGKKITSATYTGTSEKANRINLLSDSTNSYYPLIYGFTSGNNENKLGATDISKVAINPNQGILKAVRFEGTVDQTDKIAVSSQNNSSIYLCGVLNNNDSYRNCYYNNNVYIDIAGALHASSFVGLADSATVANSVKVTTTDDNDSFYLPFVRSYSSGNKTLYVNSGILVNPNEKSITASRFIGVADSAIQFKSGKTITLEGVITGSTTSTFLGSTSILTSLSTKYMPVSKNIEGSLNGRSISLYWQDGSDADLKNSSWIAYLVTDPTYLQPLTCVFKHTSTSSTTSSYKIASDYQWQLKVESGNTLTLQWYNGRDWVGIDDYVGTVVFVPIKI